MREALDKHLVVGICTMADERSAKAVAKKMLGDIRI